jgi:RHS repeat-associated protein
VLAPSGESLTLTGNGSLSLKSAGVVVDSVGQPAASIVGNGSIKAPSVGVVGSVSETGNGSVEHLTTGIAPVPDPLAGLQAPSVSLPNPIPSVRLVGNGQATIAPGLYREISVTGNGALTLLPGTYVILHQFTSAGNGSLSAKGVTLYLACSSYPTPCKSGERGAELRLTGNGHLELTGPTERCSPVAIFADPESTAPLTLTGNGAQSVEGAIYAKSGSLALTGNGGTFVLGGSIDVGKASMSGNGEIEVTGSLPFTEGLALSLTPSRARPRVGETETLTATLSCHGRPLGGEPVAIAVQGANPHSATLTTNESGEAVYTYTGEAVGIDHAQASYDANGARISSAPASIEWAKALPAITTKPQATSVIIGEPIQDTASVSGGYLPTGNVSFNVYAANDTSCTTPLNLQPLTAPLSAGKATSPAYIPAEPGTYQFIASYEGNADNEGAQTKCGDPSEQVTVVGYIGPVEPQPQDQTVNEGQTATFSASVAADPAATAQWQVSSDGGKSWSADSTDEASTSSAAGKTTSTLMVASAARGQNGYEYRAVFTNAAGSVTSNAATLDVHWIGPIESQPQSVTAGESQYPTFTAVLSASPEAMAQWQVSTDGGLTWEPDTIDVPNTSSEGTRTSSTLRIVTVRNGYEYRAVFTNAAGSVTSEPAILSVDWIGPIEVQPKGLTVIEGQSARFTSAVSANPGALADWQVSTNEGTTWETDTTDATSTYVEGTRTTSTLEVTHAHRTQDGYEYRVVFTNGAGTLTSAAATLNVNWIGPPSGPESEVADEGRPALFTASVPASPGVSAQWQVSTNGGLTWEPDSTDSASAASQDGVTSSTLTIASANRTQNGYEYRVLFTNAAGSVTSGAASLTVDWIGPIDAQPQSTTVDEGRSATITSIVGASPQASVQWEVSTNGGVSWEADRSDQATSSSESGITQSTLTVANASFLDNADQYRVVFTNAAGSLTLEAATLNVDWIGPVEPQPQSQVVVECEEQVIVAVASSLAAFPLSSRPPCAVGVADPLAHFTAGVFANPGASVHWQVSTDGGVTWQEDTYGQVVNSPEPFGMLSTLTLYGVTRAENGFQYRAVFANADGTILSKPATLTVYGIEVLPPPPKDQTVDEGEPASFTAAASAIPAAEVEWQVSTNGGFSWEADRSDQALTTTESDITTSTLTIAAASASQSGDRYRAVFRSPAGRLSSEVAVLSVLSSWIGPVTTQPESQTVLQGSQATFTTVLTASPPASVQWQLSTDSGATWSNVTTEGIATMSSSGRTASTLTIANAQRSQSGYEYRARFTNSAGSVTSQPAALTVLEEAPLEGSCTDIYIGPSQGLWEKASNWSTGKTPTAGDVACVHAGDTVKVTATGDVAGVLLDAGGLLISSGSLELPGMLEFAHTPGLEASTAANLTLAGGTLSLGSALEVSTSFTVSHAPVLSGQAKLVLGPSARGTIGSAAACSVHLTLSGTTLENQGTLAFGESAGVGAGAIALEDGAQIENAGTFNDNSYDSGCGYGVGGNHSSIYAGEGTVPQITNTGAFNANAGTSALRITVPFSNQQGTVKIASGTLELAGGGSSNGGTWSTAGRSLLSFPAGRFSSSNDNASGAAVELAGATLNVPSGTSTVGELIFGGGTIAIAGELKVSSFLAVGGERTISGSGKLTLASGAEGEIGTGAACSANLILSAVAFENQGTLTFGLRPGVGEGAIAMENGARIENAGTFNDNSYNGGCGYGVGSARETIYTAGSGATPQITNTGTFNANGGTQLLEVQVPFSNRGTLGVGSGRLGLLDGGEGADASWLASAGAQLLFGGGSFALSGDTWSGAVAVSGASVSAPGLKAAGASLSMSEGSLRLPAGTAASVSALSMSGGTLGLGGELGVSSTFAALGESTVSGQGKLVLGPSARGTIGSAAACSVHLALSGITLENQGTLTFGEGAGVSAGAIALENGAHLENGGTFNDDSYDAGCGYGAGASHYTIYSGAGTAPQISNTGQFTANGGGATLDIGVPFSNQGALNVEGGTLGLLAGGAGSGGTWQAAAGATLSFGGGSFALHEGSVSGAGTLNVSSAAVGASALKLTGAALSVTGGSLSVQVNSALAVPSLAITAGTVTVSEGVSVSPLATIAIDGGTLRLPSGAFAASSVGILDGGTLSLAGELDVTSSLRTGGGSQQAIEGQGKLLLGPGATGAIDNTSCSLLRLNGTTLINQGTLTLGQSAGSAGEMEMEGGALLENPGTVNLDAYQSSCMPGPDAAAIQNAGGGTPSLTNTGTFNIDVGTLGGTSVSVPFLNDGTVHALAGSADFTGGGISGQIATGCWYADAGASLVLGGGAFLIEEGGTFQVQVQGATVTYAPNGLSGSLEAHRYAAGTVTIAGHGEESDSSYLLQSATVEATPAGAGDWMPVGAPVAPGSGGLFTVQWNTASGSFPDGNYELRAKLQSSCSCAKSSYSAPISVRVKNAPLTLLPTKAGPNPVGATQRLTAELSDSSGAPLAGKTVEIQVEGTNPQKLSAATNSEGKASFSYKGAAEGTDTLQALYSPPGEAAVSSNTATVSWFLPQREISSTPVQGNFFYANTSGNGFTAKPGDTPAFSQTFPNIDFNPPAGTFKHDPWFVDSTTRPFTDLTTDQAGQVDGASIAQGNGLQAGVGKLEAFAAEFTASFDVAAAGDVTLKVTSEDGFMLGIGGGATRVSGPYENAPESNSSPFRGLPLAAAYNKACCSSPQTYMVTVHFPAPGSYPYELDYFQHGGQQLSLVVSAASVTPDTSPLSVFVGYADSLRPASGIFPFPWEGSPAVTKFIGSPIEGAYDSGALRFDNNGETPIVLEDVSVDIGSFHFELWGHGIEVAPHGITVLAQTAFEAGNWNFDTSDFAAGPCSLPSTLIPQIHVTIQGKTQTYYDSGQVLNTGGVDEAGCPPPGPNNESHPWTRVGGEGIPINLPLPPAVLLTLSPTRVSGDQLGQTQSLTVIAHDASGKAVSDLPVELHIYGPNVQNINVTTNAAGVAEASYIGKHAGSDAVTATASISGLQTASNELTVPWAVPQPPTLPPPAPERSGSQPPSVEMTNPAPGSIVTGPTLVAAKVSAASPITGWKATLTPAGGSATTLGQGSGTPPQTLGRIEPAKLGEGTYQLALSAETSGGRATATETITIGTVPGIAPPAPSASESGYPTLEAVTPPNGSVIGVATAVGAKAKPPEGQAISKWKVTLAPEGGAPITLAETSQEHPTQLALIEPSKLESGTYTLTVRVEASGGGYATRSETLTLGTGVADETSTTTTSSSSSSETTSTTSSTSETTTSTTSSAPALPPVISALSPAEGTIVQTPVAIKAKLKAPEGESIASWSVGYEGAHGENSGTLASGTGTPPETLATFDATKVPNGSYKLTVIATDSGGGVAAESTSVVVSGNLKLGRFLKTYKDLEVPVAGFDMQLERVYDSTDKSVGDFGVGWHLQLSDFRVSTNGPLGQGGWTRNPTKCALGELVESSLREEAVGVCPFAYESSPQHTVTVTWPDQHTEVFIVSARGQLFNLEGPQPAFKAEPGTNTTSTLAVDEPEEIIYGFDGNLYDEEGSYWNSTRFILTTRTGQKYLLSTESGLISEEDANHNRLTVSANGIESSAGPKLSFTRDSQGRITEVTGPSGQHLHYGYDSAGDLTSYTDANGNTTTYTYDSNHDLLSTTGPGASKPLQTLRYNEEGRLSEVIDAEGHATKIATNVGARTETIADPNGKLTTIDTYDERGDPIEEAKIAEGKTLVTKHTYDSEGHLLSTTDPEGHTTTNEWDASGDLVSHTDANGNTTSYEYNPAGELIGVVGPGGKRQLTITRDKEGQPTRIERADGSAYSYEYDAQGNPTRISTPSGTTEKIEYDANGYPKAITDAEGNTTHLSYDSSGRLTEEEAPTGAKTSYAYDPNGNLTAITDGLGHTTTFAYDPLGNLVSSTDPLGKSETMSYDEAGHLLSRTDRNGETTTYAYDADGNVTEEVSGNGESTKTTYDGFERPVSIQNQTQTLGFAYDADGRVSEASASAVGAAPATTLKYTYDGAGNRTSMTGPYGTTTYSYDPFSRLASLTPAGEPEGKSFAFSYTPTGQLEKLTRPNGVTDTLTYQGEELLSRTSKLGAATLASSTYTYNNNNGLRSSLTDTEGKTTLYAYDPLGELIEEAPEGVGATKYEYDAAGNRKAISGPSGSAAYSYNEAEELTSNGTEALSYNANGQLAARTVIATGARSTYEWNTRGELTAIDLPSGKTLSFAYDPLGRRVSASNGEKTVSYVYDGQNVNLEYEGSGSTPSSSPSAVYTDGLESNQVLEMARGAKRYSYLVDGQGSTLALTDEAGNVVQRYAYDAFGNPTISGSLANPFLYTGQMWEPESGLYYDRARWYEPESGRFVSRDPVLHANPYVYVESDAPNFTDPTGAFALGEIGAAEQDEEILEGSDLSAGARLVQDIARRIASEGKEALPARLTQAQRDALARSPGLLKAFLGTAVHNAVAQELGETAVYFSSSGPDFRYFAEDPEAIVELTTPGQVAAHVARGGLYEDAEIVTYTLDFI